MVFKKFTDRILSAGTTAANALLHGPEQAEKIRQLECMGFSAERARHALNATEGDVDRAAELLLLGANAQQEHRAVPSRNDGAVATTAAGNSRNHDQRGTAVAAHNDDQMRRAIEESLMVNQWEESRQVREVIDLTGDNPNNAAAAKPTKNTQRNNLATKQPAKQLTGGKSAAAINAGKAAATRHTNITNKKTLSQTHPNVQLPEKLSNKTKEEQILRCANRVKPHVMAVDTLLRVLTSVRDSPDNPKFRTIDRTNANYAKHVKDATLGKVPQGAAGGARGVDECVLGRRG